jgi:hypothetical protein
MGARALSTGSFAPPITRRQIMGASTGCSWPFMPRRLRPGGTSLGIDRFSDLCCPSPRLRSFRRNPSSKLRPSRVVDSCCGSARAWLWPPKNSDRVFVPVLFRDRLYAEGVTLQSPGSPQCGAPWVPITDNTIPRRGFTRRSVLYNAVGVNGFFVDSTPAWRFAAAPRR